MSPSSDLAQLEPESGSESQFTTPKERSLPIGKVLAGAAIFVLGLTLASAAGVFTAEPEASQTNAMRWPGPLGLCLNPEQGSVCFDQPNEDGVMHLVASGLKPESILTIESSAGNMNLEVDADGRLDAEIGGELVARDFTTTGTWSNGDPIILEVLMF